MLVSDSLRCQSLILPDDLSNRKTRVFDPMGSETRHAHVSLIKNDKT